MTKKIVLAKNKYDLKNLIQNEIDQHGYKCNLNHIDVSNITDMSELFEESEFNGDISKWDVSKVNNMTEMFSESKFNGNISNWNTSNVKYMSGMFSSSKFNGDLSQWNVINAINILDMFLISEAPRPFWYIQDNDLRKKTIEAYNLNNELQEKLITNEVLPKKIKI